MTHAKKDTESTLLAVFVKIVCFIRKNGSLETVDFQFHLASGDNVTKFLFLSLCAI